MFFTTPFQFAESVICIRFYVKMSNNQCFITRSLLLFND